MSSGIFIYFITVVAFCFGYVVGAIFTNSKD